MLESGIGETPFFAVRINTIKREEMLNFYKELLKELIEKDIDGKKFYIYEREIDEDGVLKGFVRV